MNEGAFVEPDKITFGEWLQTWFEIAIKGKKKLRTIETYESVIKKHLAPALGAVPLQKLDSTAIERYYAEKKLSQTPLEQHSTIIHSDPRPRSGRTSFTATRPSVSRGSRGARPRT